MGRSFVAVVILTVLTSLALLSVSGAASASEDGVAATAVLVAATTLAQDTAATAEAQPTATPVPSPTPTATATATASPTAPATPTATATARATATATAAPTLPAEADTGKAVVIDQAVQLMYLYEDGELIRVMPVSTGKPTSSTYTPAWEGRVGHYVGTFTSFGTTQDEGWFLFQGDGGILIHGSPYLLEDGVKVYQEMEALGKYPASHGCIRLSPEDAVWFTRWGPEGAYGRITPLPKGKFR